MLSMGDRNLPSSAKKKFDNDIDTTRSWMYKRNKIGPRTVPCGTPDNTGAKADDTVPILTDLICLIANFR